MDKPEIKIEESKRKTLFTILKPFCYFAGEHDYVEVTEWTNGEGVDVEISGKLRTRFQLTYGEYDALKKLMKKIRK